MQASEIGTRARFWFNVEEVGECWLWTASCTSDGYGHAWLDGVAIRAHRMAYLLEVGPIPEGLTLDHICRVRRCVNPSHLRPLSNRENVMIGEGACAVNARKVACPNGHPYDGVDHRGRRLCQKCHRERARINQANRRARRRGFTA